MKLFALHAADGTPIMLTDSREAAIANAWSNELQAVSVHYASQSGAAKGIRDTRACPLRRSVFSL